VAIVSDQYTPGWATEAALAQIENALTQNDNNINAILTAYDGMAYGAMQAVDAQGLTGQVYITGQDMELAAAQAIVEGRMFGSVWVEFGEMGKRAAETAIAIAHGEEFASDDVINNGLEDVPWVQVPIILVTNEVMPEWACAHQWWLATADIYANAPDAMPDCSMMATEEATPEATEAS
jgi:D-xylose transport system substrate-binding protein